MQKEESHSSQETDNQLKHLCELKFDGPPRHERQTSIICSISITSNTVECLTSMMKSGMNVCRLNFSHDSHEQHLASMHKIREAADLVSKKLGYIRLLGIAVDIKGPEIRTGVLEGAKNREVELRKGDFLRLSINHDLYDKGTRECVYIDYPQIINVVTGTRIFLDDGALLLIVKETALDCVICQVEIGGILGNKKIVNLPDVHVDLPPVSEKDRFDIKFAVDNRADFVFASHIRTKEAVPEIRSLLGEKGKHIKIIAKIENRQCLQLLDDIVKAADGILFARANLAIEMPVEKVFILQKALAARCIRAGKPFIIATYTLTSMRFKPRPTLTEIFDLSNSILDGVDCVMLSAETGIGKYPVETVKLVESICHEAEEVQWFNDVFNDMLSRNPATVDAAHSIAISAVDAAKKTQASVIVVLTTSGRSAHLISSYRPHCPILAITRCARTARQCYIYRGIIPLYYTNRVEADWIQDIENRVNYALFVGKKMNIVKAADPVIVISPWKDGGGFTNNMRILYAFFETEPLECVFKENIS